VRKDDYGEGADPVILAVIQMVSTPVTAFYTHNFAGYAANLADMIVRFSKRNAIRPRGYRGKAQDDQPTSETQSMTSVFLCLLSGFGFAVQGRGRRSVPIIFEPVIYAESGRGKLAEFPEMKILGKAGHTSRPAVGGLLVE
jgi:hypothetical protein